MWLCPIHRTNNDPGTVVKVALTNFTEVGRLTLSDTANILTSVASGDDAYFG
jgi:hypothetical protein